MYNGTFDLGIIRTSYTSINNIDRLFEDLQVLGMQGIDYFSPSLFTPPLPSSSHTIGQLIDLIDIQPGITSGS